MFFNSLFFPLFSLLFSSHTHSLSHAHALSYLLALFSVVYVVHGSFTTLKRKKERAAFQLLFFYLFLSFRRVFSLKKCRRKKVFLWTLLLRERPKLLFDFDSRLGFKSRGTFEKNSSSFSSKAQQKKKKNNNNNNHN